MINLISARNNKKKFIQEVQKKDPSFDVESVLNLDSHVRSLQKEVEDLRCEKNRLAEQAKGGITAEIRQQSIDLGQQLKEKNTLLESEQAAFKLLYLECPNVPDSDVPEGNKEANKVVQINGKKKEFSFKPKNHVDLGQKLRWFDFSAAASMTQSNFVMYRGTAVKVMYALTQLMLKNNMRHGYEPILPPYLVNEDALTIASNFPKFKDQVYKVTEDNLYLSPTAEVNLTSIYKNHIFAANELPMRMTAWTSCFRREAGSYGATERGLIRIHQFEKVELYTISEPKNAAKEQEKMLACAQDVLQALGLHYRISLLAAQDCSFPSAKTYDIEVWLPGQEAYYEVSSISNCTDFQARRGSMRYRENEGEKPQLVHTLNGSSLALPRLLVAIMETYQQEDGTILIPEALKKYML